MKFDLEVNEVNIILSALGQMPYAQVFEVVAKIQQQAQNQESEIIEGE